MNRKFSIALLLTVITFSVQVSAQSQLFLTGGTDLSGLSYNYAFQQQGNVLKRGWLGKNGRRANGAKYAANVSLLYRISQRFGIETGLRFSDMGLSVYDSRFLNTYSIQGGQPKNNINGTYSDNGNFNIVEWYLSNYLSGYLFIPTQSRIQPYLSAGVAYNYFASKHADISNTFTYSPTGENLQLTAHYSPNYFSAFLEPGILIHLRQDKAIGPVIFVGLKYVLAGKVISGDYQNTRNGSPLYSDHVTATASCLSLSIRIGGLLFSMKKMQFTNKD